jgi:transketolase N-terminal domain/subunit
MINHGRLFLLVLTEYYTKLIITTIMNKSLLTRGADNIRILAASMVEKAKSGHPGGAMGGADFVNVLYSSFLVTDPDDPCWFARDRFFLDPGHMSPMLYSVLALTGKYSLEDLQQFRQWGSVTPGHPEVEPHRGVENTSGPLGQGHTMAVGSAIAERFLVARFGETLSHKTYAFISDGGVQEEISQGAGRIAGFLGLSNLIMFYDCNKVQLSTDVDAVNNEDYAAKYRAWHWNVIEINGNDPIEIADAITRLKLRPNVRLSSSVTPSWARALLRLTALTSKANALLTVNLLASQALTTLRLSRTSVAMPKILGLSLTTLKSSTLSVPKSFARSLQNVVPLTRLGLKRIPNSLLNSKATLLTSSPLSTTQLSLTRQTLQLVKLLPMFSQYSLRRLAI